MFYVLFMKNFDLEFLDFLQGLVRDKNNISRSRFLSLISYWATKINKKFLFVVSCFKKFTKNSS
jgi:hypothetical protein